MDNTTSTATLPSFAPGAQAAAPEPAQAYECAQVYEPVDESSGYFRELTPYERAAEELVALDAARYSCRLAAEMLDKTADGPADAFMASSHYERLVDLPDEMRYLVDSIKNRTVGLGADARRLYDWLDAIARSDGAYTIGGWKRGTLQC